MSSKQPKKPKKSQKSTLNKDDIANCLNTMKNTFDKHPQNEEEPEDQKPDLSAFKIKDGPALRKAKKKDNKVPKYIKEEQLSEEDVKPIKTEIKEEIMDEEDVPTDKPKRKKRDHVNIVYEENDSLKNSTKWSPKNWRLTLENIREMRSKEVAPVDTMGCDKCPDESATPEIMRYQCLISLMLSSQTKDQVTHAAMERLKEHGLTVDNILKTPEDTLAKLIHPVGFYKTKAKYIRQTTQMLKDSYNSDIPSTVEELCKLKGVGPKMAHICMSVAWNIVTGIGVDTHVHRISNWLEWVKKPTKNPEETRKALEAWLPRELWAEVNHLLVGFGQTVCTPVKPKCTECLNLDICPHGQEDLKKTFGEASQDKGELEDIKPDLSAFKIKDKRVFSK